jgi:hypothetical protein
MPFLTPPKASLAATDPLLTTNLLTAESIQFSSLMAPLAAQASTDALSFTTLVKPGDTATTAAFYTQLLHPDSVQPGWLASTGTSIMVRVQNLPGASCANPSDFYGNAEGEKSHGGGGADGEREAIPPPKSLRATIGQSAVG